MEQQLRKPIEKKERGMKNNKQILQLTKGKNHILYDSTVSRSFVTRTEIFTEEIAKMLEGITRLVGTFTAQIAKVSKLYSTFNLGII